MQVVESLSSVGLEHVLCFTAVGGKVLLRHYLIRLLKSAEGRAPHVQLTEMGPSMDLCMRRVQTASDEAMKAAMTQP